MCGLVLAPTTVLAEPAEFTYYEGLETPTAPPANAMCKQVEPVLFCSQTSFWFDDTSDPRMTGYTTVQAKFKGPDFANGHVWGTFQTEPLAFEGTWEGTWTGKLIDGVPFFKAVGHGTGELEGLQMKASFEGSPDGILISGRILDPHGG
jgi:hypothetical protein